MFPSVHKVWRTDGCMLCCTGAALIWVLGDFSRSGYFRRRKMNRGSRKSILTTLVTLPAFAFTGHAHFEVSHWNSWMGTASFYTTSSIAQKSFPVLLRLFFPFVKRRVDALNGIEQETPLLDEFWRSEHLTAVFCQHLHGCSHNCVFVSGHYETWIALCGILFIPQRASLY